MIGCSPCCRNQLPLQLRERGNHQLGEQVWVTQSLRLDREISHTAGRTFPNLSFLKISGRYYLRFVPDHPQSCAVIDRAWRERGVVGNPPLESVGKRLWMLQ